MLPAFTIMELKENKGATCRAILESLPQWFGIPEAVQNYVAAAETLPMLAVRTEDGDIAGFLSLKFNTTAAAEAYVLGVRPEWHRKGIGTALFQAAAETARANGARYLTVKTLAASHPDLHYRATRLFYEAIGFEPVEIFPTLWEIGNPCLLMLKRLD